MTSIIHICSAYRNRREEVKGGGEKKRKARVTLELAASFFSMCCNYMETG